MEQQVTVIGTDGRQAVVTGRRASACGDCAGKASCSTMGSWQARMIELKVNNSLNASIGDEVLLEVPDGLLLKVAFRIYAVPMLIFVLTGSLVAWLATLMLWPQPELIAALAALVSVPLSYLLILRRSRRTETMLDLRMLRIVTPVSSHIPIVPISAKE